MIKHHVSLSPTALAGALPSRAAAALAVLFLGVARTKNANCCHINSQLISCAARQSQTQGLVSFRHLQEFQHFPPGRAWCANLPPSPRLADGGLLRCGARILIDCEASLRMKEFFQCHEEVCGGVIFRVGEECYWLRFSEEPKAVNSQLLWKSQPLPLCYHGTTELPINRAVPVISSALSWACWIFYARERLSILQVNMKESVRSSGWLLKSYTA